MIKDKTYTEAKAEADDRAEAAIKKFARQVGVYYQGIFAATGDQQLAKNAAERLAMIYESGMERGMNAAFDKVDG